MVVLDPPASAGDLDYARSRPRLGMSEMPSRETVAGPPAAALAGEVAVMGANPRWSSRDASSGVRFLIRTPAELAAMDRDALLTRLGWIRAAMAPDAGGMDWNRSPERKIAMRERRQLENEYSRRMDSTRRKEP